MHAYDSFHLFIYLMCLFFLSYNLSRNPVIRLNQSHLMRYNLYLRTLLGRNRGYPELQLLQILLEPNVRLQDNLVLCWYTRL